MKPMAKSDSMNRANINIIATIAGDGLFFGFHAPHNTSDTTMTARYHIDFSSDNSKISLKHFKSR